MAKLISCACGWTMVTPFGEADLKKHAAIHLADAHPGMNVSDQEMAQMKRTV